MLKNNLHKLIFNLPFIIFCLFCHIDTFAFDVSGRAFAELDSIPLAGVDCQLIQNGDTISKILSDNQGNFFFSVGDIGNYTIRLSKSGYNDAGVSLMNLKTDVQIGNVFLNSAVNLDELTVTATSISISRDKLIITPSDFDVKSSVKAPELLAKLGIPGLYFNIMDNTISINSEAPVVLIDGVPATQKQLQSINASDVLNVEFSNNVPLNFRSQGSSILRIKLKQRNDGGSFGLTALSDITGMGIDPNTYFDYHKGPSKFTVGYYFSYRHNHKTFDELQTEYMNPSLKVKISDHLENPFIYRTHNAYFSYDYTPDESMIFSANLQLYANNNLSKTSGHINDSMLGEYTSSQRHHGNSVSPSLDLFFSKTFGEKNLLQVNVTGSMSHDDYENFNQFKGLDFEKLYNISTLGRRFSLMTSLYYLHNFTDKTTISASYENMVSRNRNKYRIEDRVVDFSENNNYFYVQLDQGFGNFWLNATTGLRLDNINDSGIKRNFVNNNSSIRLQWNINQKMYAQIGAAYQPSIFSPRIIVDIPQQTNIYLISTGNPDIKRAQTLLQYLNLGYSTDLSVCRIGGNFHFDHATIYNPILTSVRYDDEKNAYISKPTNGNTSNNFNTYLSVYCSNLFKMFGIQGRIQHRHFLLNDGHWKKSYNCWGGEINVSWQYKKWLISYGRTFPLKFINGYNFFTSEENGDYLMLRFRPNQNWTFSATWMYLFSKKDGSTTSLQTHRNTYLQDIVKFTTTSIGSGFRLHTT